MPCHVICSVLRWNTCVSTLHDNFILITGIKVWLYLLHLNTHIKWIKRLKEREICHFCQKDSFAYYCTQNCWTSIFYYVNITFTKKKKPGMNCCYEHKPVGAGWNSPRGGSACTDSGWRSGGCLGQNVLLDWHWGDAKGETGPSQTRAGGWSAPLLPQKGQRPETVRLGIRKCEDCRPSHNYRHNCSVTVTQSLQSCVKAWLI